MMETDETGTWIDVLYSDIPTNMNTDGIMFVDYVKPEFTYEYANMTIGSGPTGDKKVKVVFDVVDKYFKESTLDKDDITVTMSEYDTEELQNTIRKKLELKTMAEDLVVGNVTYKANGEIYYNIGGGNQKIGERYELTISGLEKLDDKGFGDGFLYSGSISLSIVSGVVTDYSNNSNNSITLTMGIDETDGDITTNEGGIAEVIDVVDPVWEVVESGESEPGGIKIRAIDKYFNSTDIDEDDITVLANGVASTEIDLELSDPTYLKLDAGGNYVTTANAEEADAVEYTIQLSNVTVENAGYVEFTPKDENGNIIEIVGGTAHYVSENGGQVKIKVAAGTAIDDSGNVSKETTFDMGFMDDTRPEVYDIQKTQEKNAKTVTMVFNVTDRNYDPTDLVTAEEIDVWLDGKLLGDTNGNGELDNGETCPLQKNLTSVEIKAEVDNTVKILGHQYTLVIRDIVETQSEFVATGRDFRELSGTLEIRIKDSAAKDLNGNKLNPEKLAISDFVDFIKPEITYKYTESSQAVPGDIDYSGKTFTMVFDIIDKYFKDSTLTIDDLTILIDNEEPDWRETGETTGVSRLLTPTDIKATFNKTVDSDGDGETEIVNAEYVIGKRYTLVLSNLEQLEILAGKEYLDYSGIITVAIANEETNGKVTDTTGNANNAKTITSGIDIKGDEQDEDDSVTVDVVDPLWEITSVSANAIDQTATIKIKGTDKFYASSDLTDKIQVFAHTGSTPGTESTEITSTVTITGADSPTPVNKTGTTEQIGDEYTITITGFAQDVNQIKVKILEDAMLDESGNGNKLKEIIVYNTLELTSSETEATSGFLGETSIQRQNIHKVVFVNSTEGSAGAQKVWDVSAAGDNSILAWYSETSAPYTVYIGSDFEIFANQNSSYLFSYIGSASSSTETEVISTESLNKLNTNSVTNMSYMFNNFGSAKMTSLNLGDFNTTNVTNMSNMFNSCGQTAMATINLGTTFNTTKVTDMSGMFQNCGQTALTTLDFTATGVTFNTTNVENMSNMFSGQTAITTFNLGENFNTAKVENMSGMFQNFGLSLTTLTLGENFYTTEVTDMSNMFNGAGATAMTTLDLGTNFDTTGVENMSGMFQGFAKNSATMTTLDLGDKFFTTAATDMSNMFKECGQTGMTTLDLGPAFTKVASTNTDMVTSCGNSNTVIKAAESIYFDKNNLKLNTDSTTSAVNYTVGTIQPTYRPIWTKVSSSIDTDDETMTIVVNGKVNATDYGDAIKTITSSVTAGTDVANIINVFVDGEVAETITQTVEVEIATETEVQYKITLSQFEETTGRQDGKNFLEWSGNVSLQFIKGSLVDAYGNKNMVQIDGSPVQIEDGTPLNANDTVNNDKMFADYILPEFTYEYADTVIGSGPTGDKKVKIVFDVTDKYFASSQLSTDTQASLITVEVDDADINSAITKTLAVTSQIVIDGTGTITYKAADATLSGTERKIGERYELLIDKLESEDGVGYSGPMKLTFPENIIADKSGNKNTEKIITIGVDEPINSEHDGNPEGEPNHTTPVIVDLVNPVWTGPHDVNSIDRTNDIVSVIILGSDKYYDTNTLETGNIKVYIDDVLDEEGIVTKELVEITDATELQTLATNAGVTDVKVGYTLKLKTFRQLSGKTKIIIDGGTISDTSGNINTPTTIMVGNIEWEEINEPLESDDENYPRYPAFRNDIVDFIDPEIKYTYSTVEGSENPDVDYVEKEVTVKFTVTDKYLLESNLINDDGTAKNISIVVDGTDVTDKVETAIVATDITDGKEYTLTVSNIQQNPNNAFDFSGTMQLIFAEGAVDDTSGNKNATKTITLDTEIGPDIVDVVSPIIMTAEEYPNYSYRYPLNAINRDIETETGTVKIVVRGTDKYLAGGTLNSAENVAKVKVKVQKPDGTVVEDASATTIEEALRVTKSITQRTTTNPQIIEYEITLGNFTTNEGIVSVIIPEKVITDTSGNGNEAKEIFVGNPSWTDDGDYTAFNESIVDFTRPVWSYVTSSITRDRNNQVGTVTVELQAFDIYKKEWPTADELEGLIDVQINGTTNTDIEIEATEPEETADTVKYTLTLSNFRTNDGQVKLIIPIDSMKDTSGNGNKETEIFVGNTTWIESDVETDTENPKYTAFRDSIVDFIRPVIEYKYEENNNNPILDSEDETVQITFTAKDTNLLASNIGLEDIKIYIDNMLVYGAGVSSEVAISIENITLDGPQDLEDGSGVKYVLTISKMELDRILQNEIFERHSGIIKFVIASGQVEDTSGNKNIETTIILDTDNGDSETDGILVDFINPNIYYKDKYINWNDRYALITIEATDRFFDEDAELEVEDITLYEETNTGELIDITESLAEDIVILKADEPIRDANGNIVGYDYVIQINNFDDEIKLKINIKGDVIEDTLGNGNDPYDGSSALAVALDNKKPRWEYVSTDTSKFKQEGKISFNVKGVDKFLDLENSALAVRNITVLKDGEVYLDGTDSEDATKITVTHIEPDNTTERSEAYKIDVTGLTEVGTYSLVFAANTLVDEFENKNATTTITFSKSTIEDNTDRYTKVTYFVSPDNQSIHTSYAHELMSVNTTGTNSESTTFRPSTLGELHNNGANPLFAEPMYDIYSNYAPMSFAGWLEVDSDGNPIYYTDSSLGTISETETTYTKVYGIYDEIEYDETIYEDTGNREKYLKAVWQSTTVVFVSDDDGDNSNDGKLPTSAVKDLETAYSKLNASGTAENNIIVIMDEVTWHSSTTLNGNATITSLYAGTDYRQQGAELKISSNITVNGDITFDNIELYANDTTVSDGEDYLANGTFTNMLIANYNDVILGRGITTPEGKYTFGAVVAGNYKTETSTETIGTHTVRVEAGKYNNIIAGSSLTASSTTSKFVTHEVVIGNMREAAISRNDKLTITGYVAMGENEQKCYPNGASGASDSYNKNYANITLYSGTFTGNNKYSKESEDIVIYGRSINGQTDGKVQFEMYGGDVTGNILAGSRTATTYATSLINTMKLYGGTVTGNVFGQGANTAFAGSSEITLQGIISITGDVFGGSYSTIFDQGNGEGNTTITINSDSATVSGGVYGGSKGTQSKIDTTGDTKIILYKGTVGNVYGSGNLANITGTATITIENAKVTGNVVGGGYNGQVGNTSTIKALGGIIQGNIYGGSQNTVESYFNSDSTLQDVEIIIGDSILAIKPTINGVIYGSGIYDKIDTVAIQLIKSANITSVYGGSAANNGETNKVNIHLKGMTVSDIYGGGNFTGIVVEANIYLKSGTATNVYGGGYKADVTTSNISFEGTANVTSVYGGSNSSGTVTTSNLTLTSGNVVNVFGGGNSTGVGTANVTLDGMTVNIIHGASKTAGNTTTTNVLLLSGSVGKAFGGGLETGATTTNVTLQGANVNALYGGNNTEGSFSGYSETTNVNVIDSEVTDVYGGNYLGGSVQYTNINIQGTSLVYGNLYGGGYKSQIGSTGNEGSTTINISGGIIETNINGGSREEVVYGTTNINIGKDATGNSELIAGDIEIYGGIFGAGSTTNAGYSFASVVGDTHIYMDNSEESPIEYMGSIFGSGVGSTYSNSTDNSTIHLKDFGTEDEAYQLVSIERTGKLNIGNSFIELTGRQDEYNYSARTSYTLNRITNGVAIYNNTTLYTQRGFNMVGGFSSFATLNTYTGTGTLATARISGTELTTNTDNRLYTLEGMNLIFAKEEGNIYANPTSDIWGDVNGMTFFGMYAIDRLTEEKVYDIYDPNYRGGAVVGFFANGTFVEGRHKTNHNITKDGFYTNVAEYGDTITVTPQIIEVIDNEKYYDWIIGADIVNYEVSLIGSTYQKESMAELVLDYQYAKNATYTVNRVSINALNTDVDLINKYAVPTISTNANNTFGLTMQTANSGWLNSATTDIYANDANGGSYAGDRNYNTDDTTEPGTIIFRLFNSVNITEQKDLGNVNVILTGKSTTEGTSNTFIVVIAVNIQTIVEEQKEQYEPKFTDSLETELDYTKDSEVDLSYTLYRDFDTTPYETGDYRVISTTVQLPAGTRLTMKDYGQGDSVNKVYYYHVTDSTPYTTETVDGVTRYIYKLSNFIEMGSTTSKYADNNSSYYHVVTDEDDVVIDAYAFEKYDISIDLGKANLSVSGDKVQAETYLELRKTGGNIKYDNGTTQIKYNLYKGKNAVLTETISNEGSSYSVVEDLSIPFKLSTSILEQSGVIDTKYHDQIAGVSIQIVDEYGTRINAPELQNFKLTNTKDTTKVYQADATGVIRIPMLESFATTSSDYSLSVTQAGVPHGKYTVLVHFYTSEDGKYYSQSPAIEKKFYITFIGKSLGLVGVDATEDSRIINKSTGLNLEGNSGVDMTLSIAEPTNSTNIRVQLYKRQPTYTITEDGSTYNGTTYELVDIVRYLEGTWETPDEYDLTSEDGSKEYMVLPRKTYTSTVELETVEFEKALLEGVTTGEYKLVFKAYNDDTLVQTLKKTFIVTP